MTTTTPGARCPSCGRGAREVVRTVSSTLPQCGVVTSVSAPVLRCGRCGEVRDGALHERSQLAVACELADAGVQSGDAFRYMRKALGLRACDLARLLGVTPETLSHWETGKAQPSRCAFVAVAAMADDATKGRTTTRDRLERLAAGRPFPAAVAVTLGAKRDG